MSVTFQLDTSGFRRAIGAMAGFTGLSIRPIIRAEAGSILKACAGDTKVATQASSDARSRLRVTRSLGYSGRGRNKGDHPVTVNAGIRGEVGRVFLLKRDGSGFRRTHDANFRPLNQHYRNSDWAQISQAVSSVRAGWRTAIAAGRKSINLARQSWVQIADAAGITLEAVPGGRISAAGIAKARAAIASNGVAYTNGTAREYSDNKAFVLELINGLPYGRKIELDRILVKNINNRARFFEQNLARGVFDSLRTIARAYPGLRINTTGLN